jgi:8-amino-7-oxononanoate synthase
MAELFEAHGVREEPRIPSYRRELEALRRAGRFRERRLYDPTLVDFASNDYLGLAERPGQLKAAMKLLEKYRAHAPKASMLVNGTHPIHRRFEERLAEANGFEAGIVVGSGFLANLALVEALVRRNDRIFMDEEYHASGVMATGLLEGRVTFFRHNDPEDLWRKLRGFRGGRAIVAVEGVYSMSGDLAAREIFDVVRETGALLIVDEAHSAGVLGEKLLGIFEDYGIAPGPGHIKMGTLGKAYGSYGAYILASGEIVSYLENRAKPIIYSTAPSVIDTALALVNFETLRRHAAKYRRRLEARRQIVEEELGERMASQILPLPVENNRRAVELQRALLEEGFVVGAIRQPTVERPILRIIPRLGPSKKELRRMLRLVKELR